MWEWLSAQNIIFALLLLAAIFMGPLYVGGPIAVHKKGRYLAEPSVEEIDEEDIPSEARGDFQRWGEVLEGEGFSPLGLVQVKTEPNGKPSTASLFIHRKAGAIAVIAWLKTQEGGFSYLEYVTRHKDEKSLTTNNSPVLGVFKRREEARIIQLPEIRDPRGLWKKHQQLARSYAMPGEPRLPREGEELRYFAQRLAATMAEQVEFGRMEPVPKQPRQLKPTPLGAVAMVWPMLKPLRQFFAWQHKRKAAEQLKKAERRR